MDQYILNKQLKHEIWFIVRSISLILNLYHSIDRICSDTSNLSKKFLAKHQRSEM